ncbi:uncharacterized protein LOC123987870 [Osmia bicornis bicornis]|uniref:uncharacterized protein LOC123987870 n=1 Tax=Osmia bicornis bicornis TaxID=1437191 RepID=UPI001EAF5E16|nr:uncharacterized protein LOC123987870 [Osmia bicornis bicornis]
MLCIPNEQQPKMIHRAFPKDECQVVNHWTRARNKRQARNTRENRHGKDRSKGLCSDSMHNRKDKLSVIQIDTPQRGYRLPKMSKHSTLCRAVAESECYPSLRGI